MLFDTPILDFKIFDRTGPQIQFGKDMVIAEKDTQVVAEKDTQVEMAERRHYKPIRVVREIPLWGIVTLVTTGVMFGAGTFINQYYGQKELFSLVSMQTAKISELTDKLSRITTNIQTKDLKDLEHDIRLGDLNRRMANMESDHTKILSSPRASSK